jgi:hypothetical protein
LTPHAGGVPAGGAAVLSIIPNTLLAKNAIKKMIPAIKLAQAIMTQILFSLLYYSVANLLKPIITNKLGRKYDKPVPAKVPMKPKIIPILLNKIPRATSIT